jgi:uncharacterized protein YbjT (DUF2867 family)
MKIVVNGGTGLIGSKTVERLRRAGHEVVAGSPQTGLNSLTGEGLDKALSGAQILIDLSNSPSFEDEPALEFFRTSTGNLIASAKAHGIGHYVALSVVGTERLQDSGYFRAKLVQETMIRESDIPYTIIHSTQFLEFLGAIAKSASADDKVVVPATLIQPIASDDVADIMADVALAPPRNAMIEISGPERFRMSDLLAKYLTATGDKRPVEASPEARYFGVKLGESSLVSDNDPHLGKISFEQWFASRTVAA